MNELRFQMENIRQVEKVDIAVLRLMLSPSSMDVQIHISAMSGDICMFVICLLCLRPTTHLTIRNRATGLSPLGLVSNSFFECKSQLVIYYDPHLANMDPISPLRSLK